MQLISKKYQNATIIVKDQYHGVKHSRHFIAAYDETKELILHSINRILLLHDYFSYTAPTELFDIEAIYGGFYCVNPAHLILENISRLAIAKENPDLPIVFSHPTDNYEIPHYHREMFDLLNIHNEFIFIRENTQIRTLHIQQPMTLFDAHNPFITQDYLDFLSVYEAKNKPTKKIFISRGNVKGRGYINNHEIEEYAVANDYEILIPENVSMQERLETVASAKEILMIEAGSFFPLLLLKNFQSPIYIIPRTFPVDFFRLIDQKGNAYFLDCKSKVVKEYHSLAPNEYSLEIHNLESSLKNKTLLHDKFGSLAFKTTMGEVPIRYQNFINMETERLKYSENINNAITKQNRIEAVSLLTQYFEGYYSLNIKTHFSAHIIYSSYLSILKKFAYLISNDLLQIIFDMLDNYKYSNHLFNIYANIVKCISPYITVHKQEELLENPLAYINKYSLEYIESFRQLNTPFFHQLLSVYFIKHHKKFQNLLKKLETKTCNTLDSCEIYKIPLLKIVYYKNFNYSQALSTIKEAMTFNKNWAPGYFHLSDIFNRMNRKDLALLYAFKAKQLNEANLTYKKHLNSLLFEQENYQHVIENLRKVDDEKWVKHEYARMYNRQKKYKEAIEAQKEALALFGNNLAHKKYLSDLLRKNKQFDEVKELNQEWMEQNPEWSEAPIQLAVIYDAEGNLDKALEYARKAVEINPYDLARRHTLMAYLRKKKEYAEIEVVAKEAIEINEYWSEAYIHLALNADAKGNLDLAIEFANTAVEKDPYNLTRKKQLAEWYKKKNLYKEAKAILKEGVDINPYWTDGFVQLSIVADLEENVDEAVNNLFLSIKANAYDFKLYQRLLDRLVKEKMFAEVNQVLADIDMLNPWWNLANTHQKYFDGIKKGIPEIIAPSQVMAFEMLKTEYEKMLEEVKSLKAENKELEEKNKKLEAHSKAIPFEEYRDINTQLETLILDSVKNYKILKEYTKNTLSNSKSSKKDMLNLFKSNVALLQKYLSLFSGRDVRKAMLAKKKRENPYRYYKDSKYFFVRPLAYFYKGTTTTQDDKKQRLRRKRQENPYQFYKDSKYFFLRPLAWFYRKK